LNGTARREVWECDDGELDLPTLQQALQAWEVTSKTIRPHQALRSETPHAFRRSKQCSNVSN
ncbi:MAG: transposase, partial [Chloroflexota bacterium]|nr:transposase [Chloroflexota bacterium]